MTTETKEQTETMMLTKREDGMWIMPNEEPVFVLRAQEVSAPPVVKFWIMFNEKLQQLVHDGMSIPNAIVHLEWHWHLTTMFAEQLSTAKLKSALEVVKAMKSYTGLKKMAD